MSSIKTALMYVWWAPSWWMTRLVIWHNPKSSWTKTTSLTYMVDCATPLFRQLNRCIWCVFAIEIVLLYQIFYLL